MKRTFWVGVLVAALCAIASAQGKPAPPPVPEFAGNWELNVNQSSLPVMQVRNAPGVTARPRLPPPSGSVTGQTMTVTQTTDRLSVATVTRTEGQMMVPKQALTFNLDGSDSTSEQDTGRGTALAVSRATVLDDGALNLETTTTIDGPRGVMTIVTRSVWTLAADGKTLRVHRTRVSPRGNEESDWVYIRR